MFQGKPVARNGGNGGNGLVHDAPVRPTPPFSAMFKGHVKALLVKSFLRILRHLGSVQHGGDIVATQCGRGSSTVVLALFKLVTERKRACFQRLGLHLHLPGAGGGRVLHGHWRRPPGPAAERRERGAVRHEPVQLRPVPRGVRRPGLHVHGRHGRRLRPARGQLLRADAVVRVPRLPRPQHGPSGKVG